MNNFYCQSLRHEHHLRAYLDLCAALSHAFLYLLLFATRHKISSDRSPTLCSRNQIGFYCASLCDFNHSISYRTCSIALLTAAPDFPTLSPHISGSVFPRPPSLPAAISLISCLLSYFAFFLFLVYHSQSVLLNVSRCIHHDCFQKTISRRLGPLRLRSSYKSISCGAPHPHAGIPFPTPSTQSKLLYLGIQPWLFPDFNQKVIIHRPLLRLQEFPGADT